MTNTRPVHGTVRECGPDDTNTIYQIINDSAKAYKPVLGPDVYHEPQMPMEELLQEMKRVAFLAYAENDEMIGVMGYEYIGDVALIRHAYVRPGAQRKGIGGILLKQIEDTIEKSGKTNRIVIGTYTAASWAISFYERHGYRKSADPQSLLTKYYDIPEVQRLNSLTLEKKLR